MKREFITSLLPDIDKSILDQIMAENGKDIEATKAKYGDYDDLKTQLAEANKTIEGFKEMDIDGIKAKADEWKQKAEQAEKDAAEKIAAAAFEHQLDAAITGAKGRNAKAIRSLLDVEALRASKNQSEDIKAAIEAVQKENDYLFEGATPPPKFAAATPGATASGMDAIRAAAGLKPTETK